MSRSRLVRLVRPVSRLVRPVSWLVRVASTVGVLWRLARAARPTPPLTHAAISAVPRTISVLIPARNEKARLEPCLAGLRHAPGVVEVIVIDDGSTDGTADLARRLGARVVVAQPLPPGWAGKAWALDQGLRAAAGEWIVTLDADTRPDPSLPGALVARMLADRLDFATVAGCFDCPTPGSRWLHPALLTTLVYRYGPPGPHTDLANGQCMAARRRAWIDTGGLEPVAADTVEDVALARHLRQLGWSVSLLDGAELLTVQMYESFAETWSGWGRSIALDGVDSRSRQLAHLAALTATQALPLLRLVARRGDLLDAGLLVCRLGTLAGTARAYRRRSVGYWLSPFADGAAVGRLAWSIIRPARAWRGRSYAGPGPGADPRRSARAAIANRMPIKVIIRPVAATRAADRRGLARADRRTLPGALPTQTTWSAA